MSAPGADGFVFSHFSPSSSTSSPRLTTPCSPSGALSTVLTATAPRRPSGGVVPKAQAVFATSVACSTPKTSRNATCSTTGSSGVSRRVTARACARSRRKITIQPLREPHLSGHEFCCRSPRGKRMLRSDSLTVRAVAHTAKPRRRVCIKSLPPTPATAHKQSGGY